MSTDEAVNAAGTEPAGEDSAVLLVDDRPENLKALAALIEPLGVPVTAAASGEEALRCLLQRDFALILLDVQMPGLDGFATARLIKAHPRTEHIPIIFLTAFGDRVDRVEEGYSSGAVDFIVKPFDPWLLRSKVQVFLDLHRKNRLLAEQADALEAHVESLRAHRAALADAQRLAHMGSWELDGATGEVVGSEQLHRIFGWPIDEPLPRADQLFTQLRLPGPPGGGRVDLRRLPGRVSVEGQLVRPDGAVRDVVVNAEPVGGGVGTGSGGDSGVTVVGTVQDVTEFRAAHRALDEATRQLERERDLVHLLQEAMAPGALPGIPELDVAACYRPAGSGLAGGDWYDVITLPDGDILFVIGDVAGRGVAAASTMSHLRTAVRAVAMREPNPAGIVREVHRYLHLTGLEAFATMLVLRLDPATGVGRLASAGHPPVVVWSPAAKRIEWMDVGPPLGTGVIGPYEESELVLEPGATIVLYTDGLVERRGESIDEGITRLLDCLARESVATDREGEAGGRPPRSDELVERLTAALCDAGTSVDDIALLVVRRPAASSDLQLSLPADPDLLHGLRRSVRRWLSAHHIHPDDVADVVLAVSELVTNVCLHAYPQRAGGRVMIEGEVVGDGVRVSVRDHGCWRPPDAERDGRGMALVRAMGMELVVDTGNQGTTVTVIAAVRRDVDPAAA
jgi:serine phosphatase RsbU (regulator of sigma subunit)/CheY-like chemotaxis protein/anti-sigma regulatory factor (Ser/Thr protein kinase)